MNKRVLHTWCSSNGKPIKTPKIPPMRHSSSSAVLAPANHWSKIDQSMDMVTECTCPKFWLWPSSFVSRRSIDTEGTYLRKVHTSTRYPGQAMVGRGPRLATWKKRAKWCHPHPITPEYVCVFFLWIFMHSAVSFFGSLFFFQILRRMGKNKS